MNTNILSSDKDPMGRAIADFFSTGKAARLKVLSSMFDDDEIPVPHLFRSYSEMPAIEQKALDMAFGSVLDVGAGSGCHSLALLDMQPVHVTSVTPIDISPLSCQTMKERGLDNAMCVNLFDESLCQRFDTILLLMNGTGVVGRLENMPVFFQRLSSLMADGGQVLIDSSDLRYLFEDEDGNLDLEGVDGYYGQVDYVMKYKNVKGDRFDWLYVDFVTLCRCADQAGFLCEMVTNGDHFDYLARLTKKL